MIYKFNFQRIMKLFYKFVLNFEIKLFILYNNLIFDRKTWYPIKQFVFMILHHLPTLLFRLKLEFFELYVCNLIMILENSTFFLCNSFIVFQCNALLNVRKTNIIYILKFYWLLRLNITSWYFIVDDWNTE